MRENHNLSASAGAYSAPLVEEMNAYNQLPPMLRAALAGACFKIAALPLLYAMRDGRSPERLLGAVERVNEKTLAEMRAETIAIAADAAFWRRFDASMRQGGSSR